MKFYYSGSSIRRSLFTSVLALLTILVITNCSPPVVKTLYNRPTIPDYYIADIKVLDVMEQVPGNAIELGILKITNNDLTKYCNYENVIELAKKEARSAGGNLLKITDHRKPDFKSSCHRIEAKIYRCDNLKSLDTLNKNGPPISSTPDNKNQLNKDSVQKNSKRNVVVIGYQIGGWNLIGLEYEIRFNDYFGFNFGAGYRGFTAGMKIHTNPKKNAPFFLASFKDGGFGLLDTYGVEYGTKWLFNRQRDYGILCQVGIAQIQRIDAEFEKYLFNNRKAPPFMFSFGAGFSW